VLALSLINRSAAARPPQRLGEALVGSIRPCKPRAGTGHIRIGRRRPAANERLLVGSDKREGLTEEQSESWPPVATPARSHTDNHLVGDIPGFGADTPTTLVVESRADSYVTDPRSGKGQDHAAFAMGVAPLAGPQTSARPPACAWSLRTGRGRIQRVAVVVTASAA